MSDLDELKRLARGATPGTWETSDKVEDDGNVEIPIGRRTPLGMLTVAVALDGLRARDANADFIAAANPAAVLALIERVEAMQREVTMLNEALAEEHAKAEAAYARGLEVHAEEAQRAESERDAYKERVALLEGWSKATTAALTGEEAAELRPAWTCEKAREMKARADKAEARVAARDKAFSDYVEQYDVEHADENCPEDDTCECPLVVALNATFRVSE